jgi:ADP-heptose:LPS heptosyltransferase
MLRPLIALAGPHLVSLQLGPEAEKAAQDGVFDASPFIADFADTAALAGELDLLITHDSAPAHLAGALGKPAWTLLPAYPDWRWLAEREDSIWYPTMRLFRQPAPGDWDGMLAAVARALDA